VSGARYFDKLYREAIAILRGLVEIPVPAIAAINGPALRLADWPVLCDIVLAADTAVFQDLSHFPSGAVPGDGNNLVWPLLLGPNRGRYFLLTGQAISAAEALELGFVAEVLLPQDLMAGAWALAREVATRDPLVCATRGPRSPHPCAG
jgi:enoyl-CoA hydratase/carnithine racemase